MKLRKLSLQNTRSFAEMQTLDIDGDVSILIGPNGGGKTNLLDACVSMLRKYLLASQWPRHMPTSENPQRYIFHQNDALQQLTLESYSPNPGIPQILQAEIEVTKRDLENMRIMKDGATDLVAMCRDKYENPPIARASLWDLTQLEANQKLSYQVNGNVLQPALDIPSRTFLEYLQMFEIDNYLRNEYKLQSLSNPIIYLPVNRSTNGFQSSIHLAGMNLNEQKRSNDATSSRNQTSILGYAVGHLALKYCLELHKDKGGVATTFYTQPGLTDLTNALAELGYSWNLECRDVAKNEFDIRLTKQGTSFLAGAASSGEKELLTYLFTIYALNIRDALIVVDEPELHLHPKWQRILLSLFVKLSESTSNQFLLATHSPTFVAPESIQYVSRVFSRNQKSQIVRLNSKDLPPKRRHLFNIVNSQNNERLFFADKVILVEGLSDRIFFEAVLKHLTKDRPLTATIEIIAVGGKGLFESYKNVLRACSIDFAIIADQDYLEEIGSENIKGLFMLDAKEVKSDVVENVKSTDGEALVNSVERAIETGSWEGANQIWEYIKSRRKRLKAELNDREREQLEKFISQKRSEGVFVLSLGALEAYLPHECKSKDMDGLIYLVNKENFWSELPSKPRVELEAIFDCLLTVSTS